jgi:hypothetical protein
MKGLFYLYAGISHCNIEQDIPLVEAPLNVGLCYTSTGYVPATAGESVAYHWAAQVNTDDIR